jgi:hypothetical protein
MRKLVFVMLMLPCWFTISAQSISVQGKFLTDSVSVGQPVQYALSVRYPSSFLVLMPDSTFRFDPFEWKTRTYFPTRSENGVSTDSLVYQLTSFEIDSIQMLALPVFVVTKADCTAVWPENDTLFFSKRVFHVPDSLSANALPLRTNTDYWKVPWQLNTILIAMAFAVVATLLIITWVIFGKKIRTYFRIRKLNRQHLVFVRQFNHQLGQLQAAYTVTGAESLVVAWKRYMEQLAGQPFTKLTTKEIVHRENEGKLGDALRATDRLIYGGIGVFDVHPFAHLREFSDEKFEQIRNQVKHG